MTPWLGSWRTALQHHDGADTIVLMTDTTPAQSCMTVLYDGDCPLCRREVGVYRGLRPLRPLHWVDVSDRQRALPVAGTAGVH